MRLHNLAVATGHSAYPASTSRRSGQSRHSYGHRSGHRTQEVAVCGVSESTRGGHPLGDTMSRSNRECNNAASEGNRSRPEMSVRSPQEPGDSPSRPHDETGDRSVDIVLDASSLSEYQPENTASVHDQRPQPHFLWRKSLVQWLLKSDLRSASSIGNGSTRRRTDRS